MPGKANAQSRHGLPATKVFCCHAWGGWPVRHGAVRLQAACSEPGDAGVDRDLDDGVAGALVLPMRAAAEHGGQGLITGGTGGNPAPERSASSTARPSSSNRTICCSVSAKLPTAPR